MMKGLTVTEYPNWFQAVAKGNFIKFLKPWEGLPNLHFLQIGAFTGDASRWLADEVLTGDGSILIDVDTWQGSPDESVHDSFDWNDVWETYKRKVANCYNVRHVRMDSELYLATGADTTFDFIYIDGDHTTQAVYRDAVGSWKILKPEGILAFDDYTWGDGLADQTKAPKPGINRFLSEMKGAYDLLAIGDQVWIRKK